MLWLEVYIFFFFYVPRTIIASLVQEEKLH